uniref:Ig-like domain-containing protein n=1 Tax=Poecilia latipinna TaxID=48699 RepID=A0A3B3UFJ0_9TELE
SIDSARMDYQSGFEMAESIGSGKSWLISVPSKIPVLESSCVVIPCEYDYPTKGNLWKKWRGYWTRGDETVASNNPKFKLKQEFKGRSRITGTIESNDCTWQLDDVRETDTGPKTCLNNYLTSNFVKIVDCTGVPEPPVMTVSVNNHASATCTVTHACPSSPPKFSWSHPGKTKTSSKKLKEGLWSTKSTLTFTPEEADFNKPLKCTVNFNDKKTTEGSVLLVKKSTYHVLVCCWIVCVSHLATPLFCLLVSEKKKKSVKLQDAMPMFIFWFTFTS